MFHIKLYFRRVLNVIDDCSEFMPEWLNMAMGFVDAEDKRQLCV